MPKPVLSANLYTEKVDASAASLMCETIKGRSGAMHEFTRVEHLQLQDGPLRDGTPLGRVTDVLEREATAVDVIAFYAKVIDTSSVGVLRAPRFSQDAQKMAEEYKITLLKADEIEPTLRAAAP